MLGSYEEISVGPGMINLAASFLNNNFSFDEYRFGGEFTLMDILALRAGLTISHDPEPYGTDGIEGTDDDADDKEYEYETDEFIWGPTFGFGINTSTMTNLNLSIDYAFRSTTIFDDTQWVTISVGF